MTYARKPGNRIRSTRGDRIFEAAMIIIGLIIMLVVAYPLYFVVIASFSKPEDVLLGRVIFWPKNISLLSYQLVIEEQRIWTGYRNTLLYASLGTVINLVLTTLLAYPLSRRDMPVRTLLTFLASFTMMFSGGMVPTYLVVRNLRLTDTIWAMMIPGAIATYNMLIMKNFFQSNIPLELQEAAQLDGCNDFRLLTMVVLPLSKAILAVITLFYVVGHWNAFFDAIIYLRNRKLYPLQLILREILLQNQDLAASGDGTGLYEKMMAAETMKYAVIIVSSLPVLILYPFVQKHFVTGVMVGAIKG